MAKEEKIIETRDQVKETNIVGRRNYLRKVGATAAAAVVSTGAIAGTSSAEKGFETIVIPEGTVEQIIIRDETLEHKLFDITAEGAGVHLIGYDDATFRNIGIKGQQPSNWRFGYNWMVLLAEEGSTVRAENIYMADGLEEDYGGGGIFVHRDHAGHCIIDKVHVANSGDNGIYASSPGQETAGHGTVEIRNCLSVNNTVSLFRIGSEGSEVYNSVGYVDQETPQYRFPDSPRTSRGIWHWYQDCEIYDVDIDMSADPVEGPKPAVWAGSDGGHLHLYDSDILGTIELEPNAEEWGRDLGELTTENIGERPVPRPPQGVPMSPESAAKRQDSTRGRKN